VKITDKTKLDHALDVVVVGVGGAFLLAIVAVAYKAGGRGVAEMFATIIVIAFMIGRKSAFDRQMAELDAKLDRIRSDIGEDEDRDG